MIFRCEIPGRCMVSKNTARVVRGRGRTREIKSPQYLAWAANAMAAITKARHHAPTVTKPVSLHITFYLANRAAEPDVSNLVEGPQDLLVKCGVLADDRLVHEVVARKVFARPARTIIEISSYQLWAPSEVA